MILLLPSSSFADCDGTQAGLYSLVSQAQKPYKFFSSSANAAEGNCWSTLTEAKNILARNCPQFEVTMATTPFNDPKGLGLISVTHPSLILKNKNTGEVITMTTDIYKENGGFNNGIWVKSLGTDVAEKSIVASLMQFNSSPIVKMGDRVYADPVFWTAWSESATKGPCARYTGTYTSLSSSALDHAELLLTSEGKLFVARRIEEKAQILGTNADVKVLGVLPGPNAAVSLAAQSALGHIAGHSVGEAASLLTMMISGNTITELTDSKDLGHGLTAGVKTDFTLNPNDPLQGFTKPNIFGTYTRQDGAVSEKYYLDSQGTSYAQLKKETEEGAERLTLGYDAKNRDLLWNLGITEKYKRMVVDASIGRGTAIGNLNLPAELARPGLGSGGDHNGSYARVMFSVPLGRKSQRAPASASENAPLPPTPRKSDGLTVGPDSTSTPADASNGCESVPSPTFSHSKRLPDSPEVPSGGGSGSTGDAAAVGD